MFKVSFDDDDDDDDDDDEDGVGDFCKVIDVQNCFTLFHEHFL